MFNNDIVLYHIHYMFYYKIVFAKCKENYCYFLPKLLASLFYRYK